jgi:hypothetical protein
MFIHHCQRLAALVTAPPLHKKVEIAKLQYATQLFPHHGVARSSNFISRTVLNVEHVATGRKWQRGANIRANAQEYSVVFIPDACAHIGVRDWG